MQPSSNTNLQFLNLLILLQTKQTLEDSKTYKEFCYQRYFLATHVELIDETYNINKTNPKYKSTYNRYFHTDALGSITSITDDLDKCSIATLIA